MSDPTTRYITFMQFRDSSGFLQGVDIHEDIATGFLYGIDVRAKDQKGGTMSPFSGTPEVLGEGLKA